jgi:hypothetical protein
MLQKKLNQIGLVFIPKSHNKVSAQNDKLSTVFHVDPRQRGVSPGLLDLGIGADGQNTAIGQDLPFASAGLQPMSSLLLADCSRSAVLLPGPRERRQATLADSLCPSARCRRMHAGAQVGRDHLHRGVVPRQLWRLRQRHRRSRRRCPVCLGIARRSTLVCHQSLATASLDRLCLSLLWPLVSLMGIVLLIL